MKIRLYTHGLTSMVAELEISATTPPIEGIIWGGTTYLRNAQGDYAELAIKPQVMEAKKLKKLKKPKKRRWLRRR